MLQLENVADSKAEFSVPKTRTTCCFTTVEDWVAQHSSKNHEMLNDEMKHEFKDDYPGTDYSPQSNLEGRKPENQSTNLMKPRMTLPEVYLLAQATRKAREKESCDENTPDSRSSMLRKAFAVQRELTASLQSEFSVNSAESKSSVEWFLNCRETDPEQLLLNLGFGGPSQGIDRIPKRFLQPSRLNGVELEKFFQIQEELSDVFETGSLGYRGLSGPPTRRPSMIVSRILEKMREQQKEELKRKFSAPPLSTPPPSQISAFILPAEQSYPVIQEHKEELYDVIDEPVLILDHRSSIKTQSTLSSRRSSLRKQDHVEELDELSLGEYHLGYLGHASENSSSSGFHESNAVREVSQDFIETSLDPTETICDEDVSFSDVVPPSAHPSQSDPILSIIRVAVQTYKSQLQLSFPLQRRAHDPMDCNHNSIELRSDLHPEPPDLAALRENVYQELRRTETLLEKCQRQFNTENEICDTTLSSTLMELANDMSLLLEKQQQLSSQLRDMWPAGAFCSSDKDATNSTDTSADSLSSRKKCAKSRKVTRSPPDALRPWLANFERRISSQIRFAVRKEIRKALTCESLRTNSLTKTAL